MIDIVSHLTAVVWLPVLYGLRGRRGTNRASHVAAAARIPDNQ